MNHRSVVVLGTAVEVTDETEGLVALETISEPIIRGRRTESARRIRWSSRHGQST